MTGVTESRRITLNLPPRGFTALEEVRELDGMSITEAVVTALVRYTALLKAVHAGKDIYLATPEEASEGKFTKVMMI